ncbi:hypothetical protein D5086_033784 [Populus alba]|uniref:Uncharacterized protein n=1 Tax=Populus alba TaxID=43335 RepID=A0ACC4AHQ4_POPAL
MDPRLLEAARRGDVIELQELPGVNDYLLERSCLNDSSETILHISCLAGRTEFVKELLKKTADLATRLNPDGFSPIHIASANGFVEITLKSLLGGQGIDIGTINVNVVYKIGLTARDMLDVSQKMQADAGDFMLRELLHGAGALRARELGTVVDVQVTRISSTVSESLSQNSEHFLLKVVKHLNPVKHYKKLAKEVQQAPPATQNVLLVVAVLIAGMAYQAILNPPAGVRTEELEDGTFYYYAWMASGNGREFIFFMASNTIGFVASIVVINLIIQEYPLKSLLGLALRCMLLVTQKMVQKNKRTDASLDRGASAGLEVKNDAAE